MNLAVPSEGEARLEIKSTHDFSSSRNSSAKLDERSAETDTDPTRNYVSKQPSILIFS